MSRVEYLLSSRGWAWGWRARRSRRPTSSRRSWSCRKRGWSSRRRTGRGARPPRRLENASRSSRRAGPGRAGAGGDLSRVGREGRGESRRLLGEMRDILATRIRTVCATRRRGWPARQRRTHARDGRIGRRRGPGAQADAATAKDLVVGIDLGTTNSLVAYIGPGRAAGDPGRGGSADSCPRWSPSDRRARSWVTQRADARAQRRARGVLGQAFMGKGFEDVREELRYFPFHVTPSEEVVRIRIGDRELTPPEVSALILRELRVRAERHLGRPSRRQSSPSRRTSTTPSGRPRRTRVGSPAWTCSGSSTSRPRPASRTGSSGGRSDRRLRPGRGDVRRLDPEDQGRHLRGARDERGHAPRRGRLRPRLLDLVVDELRTKRRRRHWRAGHAPGDPSRRRGRADPLSSEERTVFSLPLPPHG